MKTRVKFYYETYEVGEVEIDHRGSNVIPINHRWNGVPVGNRAYFVVILTKRNNIPERCRVTEIELVSLPMPPGCSPDDPSCADRVHMRRIHAKCWYDEEGVYVVYVEDGYAVNVRCFHGNVPVDDPNPSG